MCTLLIYQRPLPGVELAVAANRDELYSRPAGSFGWIELDPPMVGGIDPEAGGTWLAASSAGFVVAVTNARLGARRTPGQRSRGLLALDLVHGAGFPDAADALMREDLLRYAALNVVVASGDGMVVASNFPEPRVERLEVPALGVGNTPVFSKDDRVAALLEMGRPPERVTGPESYASHLRELMARHDPPTACHHLEHGGTVSSTVMLLAEPFQASLILHAAGPPCMAPWRKVAAGFAPAV